MEELNIRYYYGATRYNVYAVFKDGYIYYPPKPFSRSEAIQDIANFVKDSSSREIDFVAIHIPKNQ